MSKVRFFSILVAVFAVTLMVSANTVEFCTGSTVNGYVSGNTWTTGGISVTSAPGGPECKTQSSIVPGGDVSGLGVSGKTGGEIDNGETVTLDFGGSVNLESFEIIVFYNGPEFGDPPEKGYLDVWFASGGSPVTYWFQADAPPATTTLTTNLGGTHANISPMTGDNAGWFSFNNPFGSLNVTKLRYTAENNPSGTNNSDYALKSVTYTAGAEEQVPEPATFALMGLGLLAVGVLKRRRA